MLVATHDLHLVERFGSRRIVLAGGQVEGGAGVQAA
jgi:ABC-type ATPase involved in cell division